MRSLGEAGSIGSDNKVNLIRVITGELEIPEAQKLIECSASLAGSDDGRDRTQISTNTLLAPIIW